MDRPGRRSCRFACHVAAPQDVFFCISHPTWQMNPPVGVVRFGICITEIVMDPMVSDPVEHRIRKCFNRVSIISGGWYTSYTTSPSSSRRGVSGEALSTHETSFVLSVCKNSA